jgi:hypothetical protein
MPKSRANRVIMDGRRQLVDADVIADYFGFTPKWVSGQAAANLIPWHGIDTGTKVYRRFDLEEVKIALAHPVKAANADAQIVNRKVATPVRQRRSARRPALTAAPAARARPDAATANL